MLRWAGSVPTTPWHGMHSITPVAPHSCNVRKSHLSVRHGSRCFPFDWPQFMMRTRGGEPVFAFELWHERLLPAAAVAARRTGG